VDGFIIQVEQRRKLGLPAEILRQAQLHPGDQVQIQVRRDNRLVITRIANVADKYIGAAPGLTAATDLPELRDQ
jgi:antitoxin component of MazEF toxin-antitoxin module